MSNSFDITSAFNNVGKMYYGVRYPQIDPVSGRGTIIPPLCVVHVMPDDGLSYMLDADVVKIKKGERLIKNDNMQTHFSFDWGVGNDPDDTDRLSFAILQDMVHEKAAKELYRSFSKTIISKLPELEWKLSGPRDVLERYAAELVVMAMGKIK